MTGDPRAFSRSCSTSFPTRSSSPSAAARSTVAASVSASHLALRVSDTGVGIAPDDLKRIGAPFFQAGQTYQRRHEGTGLGLSIVKSLVSLHRGELTVQSKLGEGTAVMVKLPLVCAASPARPSEIKPAESKITTLTPAPRHDVLDQPALVKKSASENLQRMTTLLRAAAWRQSGWQSRSRPSAVLRCVSCCTVQRTRWRAWIGGRGCQRHRRQRAVPADRPPSGADVRHRDQSAGCRRPLRCRTRCCARRPLAADTLPLEPKPMEFRAAEPPRQERAPERPAEPTASTPRSADPLTNLVKATASPPPASSAIARPPALIPTQNPAARRIASVQRALSNMATAI